MRRRLKVLAIASGGGHWVQLRRLRPSLPDDCTVWATTRHGLRTPRDSRTSGSRIEIIPDATRWDRLRLAWCGIRVAWLVLRHRPSHIITTGAAPGYFAIVAGRLLGAKTLWIDSMANAEELSLSGMKATRWASEVWTQWPELESDASISPSITYRGSVL